MVAQLIRLKARVLWNSLTRQAWMVVLILLGLVWGLGMLVLVAVGLVSTTAAGHLVLVAEGTVLAGALLVAGWVLLPVVFASIDNTLDPRRFAPYVGPSRRLAVALIAATPVGVGGLFSTLVVPVVVIVWMVGGDPLAALLALLGGAVGLATCFVWARVTTTWLGVRLTATSGRRDLTSVLATMLFVVILAPMGVWMQVLIEAFDPTTFARITEFVSWTPLGAPWAVALSAHAGRWGAAGAQLLVALATLAVGGWAWLRVLPRAMAGVPTPLDARVDDALAHGRALVDPSLATADQRRTSATGAQRWFPGVERWQRLGLSVPAASLAQRTHLYWIRDPRLLTSLLSGLLFPAMAVFWTLFTDAPEGTGTGMALFFMLFLALVEGSVVGTLMQYDSTALWLVIASGMRGRDERLARLVGSAPLVGTLVLGSTIVFSVVAGVQPLPSARLLAAVLVMLMATCAVTQVISARWVYPVQPPGTSPMSTRGTGQFLTTMIIQTGEWLLSAVAAAPALALLALAQWGGVPDVVALPVAVAWGVGLAWGGVELGGRVWDQSSVEVLTKIRAWPGHATTA